MKKFLSVVSLLLVAMMILAMPTVSAAEDDSFVVPEGINVYYANDVSENAPSVDGTIEEGEYGKLSVKIDAPVAMKNSDWGSSFETEPVDDTLRSSFMDFYFAYDAENIYIAIYEECPPPMNLDDAFEKNNVNFRNNYSMNFGFDPTDVTSYFGFSGFATNNQWANLSYFDAGSKSTTPLKTYDIISECIVKRTDLGTGADVTFGDLVSANGNANYTAGQWSLTIEMKFDKAAVAEGLNQTIFTNYDTISDAMWFTVGTNAYRAKADDLNDSSTQYWKWLGVNDIRENQDKYVDYGIPEGSKKAYMADLIVFAPEGAEIKIANPEGTPETEPPVTEPEVTEPEVTEPAATEPAATEPAATEPAATEPAATEPAAEGGCGSVVSFAGLALVAALGTCTVFVAKKKED